MAVALSVTVEADASLTVNSGGSLTIAGASGDGLSNAGTMTNEGTLNIDDTGDDGLDNHWHLHQQR